MTTELTMTGLRAQLPAYANDIKLNLSNVLDSDDATLNRGQRLLVALASAYATRNAQLQQALEHEARAGGLDAQAFNAARIAVSVMAMNNVYYRFIHLAHDAELSKLPARLRMQGLLNHGIAKADFELMALGVSAINGCGMCIEAHVKEVQKHGLSINAVQEVARIAAVIHAGAQVLALTETASAL